MAFNFVTEAWEDGKGNRYRGDPLVPETWGPKTRAAFPGGEPRPVETVYGVFIRIYDPRTGEVHRYWNFTYKPFTSAEAWVIYIGALAEQHGMSLA